MAAVLLHSSSMKVAIAAGATRGYNMNGTGSRRNERQGRRERRAAGGCGRRRATAGGGQRDGGQRRAGAGERWRADDGEGGGLRS